MFIVVGIILLLLESMWKILAIGFAALATLTNANAECPLEREIKCVDDLRAAYPYCEKAAAAKGKDMNADLQCMKYFYSVEQDCWPCICFIAQKEHWKIKGCNALRFE